MIRTAIGWTFTFVLVGTAGAVSWFVSRAALPAWLLDTKAGSDLAHSPLFELFGIPACMIAAGAAGFVAWRGFFLWGLAAALPGPPLAGVVAAAHLVSAGYWSGADAYREIVMALIVFFGNLMLCSATSAVGAGLGVAGRRLVGRPAGGTL